MFILSNFILEMLQVLESLKAAANSRPFLLLSNAAGFSGESAKRLMLRSYLLRMLLSVLDLQFLASRKVRTENG